MGGAPAPDPHSLERFRVAQERDGTYARAITELRAGHKRSHWMWFVFPQLRGLGSSEASRHFGLASLQEARDYLADPLLGGRLRECAAVLDAIGGRSALDVFGPVDALKLRSCMTLFARAADEPGGAGPFRRVLGDYFAGEPDPATERLLAQTAAPGVTR